MSRSKISGTRSLRSKLKQNRDLQAVKDVVLLNGTEMAQKAQRKAPVKTGNLKGSIRMEIEDGGMQVEVSPHTEYDMYVEGGTRFQEAQPFVGPSYREQKIKFIADLKELCE